MMKHILLVALIATQVSCSAKDTSAPKNISSPASGLVSNLVADPEVLTKSAPQILAALPKGCSLVASGENLDCPPIPGVASISVQPGPLGIVDVIFLPPTTCQEIFTAVASRYGQGKLEEGNSCKATWSLKKGGKAYIKMAPGKKNPEQIYFQFAIEQGP